MCFLVALCHLIVRRLQLEVRPGGFFISRQRYSVNFRDMPPMAAISGGVDIETSQGVIY